jgi:ethanolaminephosphotransferase
MVTVSGVVFQMLAIVMILCFDTTQSLPIPSICYIIFVLFQFLQQTLDAVDGIHARNTKRGSPLGQLMDHGCDAFSNSFAVIMICQAHLFGCTFNTFLLQASVQVIFI